MLWTLLIFLAPCASIALTNTLGGLGADFHTPESLVGLIGGLGISIAGVCGSLAIPVLARFVPPRPLYLMVGGLGAVFTLTLILMARSPTTFGVAMLGENVFQAASFSVGAMITLRTIGHDNPLAATQFAVLNAALLIPPTYMQELDGIGYGWGGLTGNLLMDASLSLAACGALGFALSLLRRRALRFPQTATIEEAVGLRRGETLRPARSRATDEGRAHVGGLHRGARAVINETQRSAPQM